MTQNNTYVSSYSFDDQKSKMGRQVAFHLESVEENLFPCLS